MVSLIQRYSSNRLTLKWLYFAAGLYSVIMWVALGMLIELAVRGEFGVNDETARRVCAFLLSWPLTYFAFSVVSREERRQRDAIQPPRFTNELTAAADRQKNYYISERTKDKHVAEHHVMVRLDELSVGDIVAAWRDIGNDEETLYVRDDYEILRISPVVNKSFPYVAAREAVIKFVLFGLVKTTVIYTASWDDEADQRFAVVGGPKLSAQHENQS